MLQEHFLCLKKVIKVMKHYCAFDKIEKFLLGN